MNSIDENKESNDFTEENEGVESVSDNAVFCEKDGKKPTVPPLNQDFEGEKTENATMESVENGKSTLGCSAKVFGESRESLEDEFTAYKAKKLFAKMNAMLTDITMSDEEFSSLIESAIEIGLESVTVLPQKAEKALGIAKGRLPVRVTVSYPYGADGLKTKIYAVKSVAKLKVSAIEIPFDYCGYINKKPKTVVKDMKKLVKKAGKKRVYIVVETEILSAAQISEVAKICREIGGIRVKSSSCFENFTTNEISFETLKNSVGEREIEGAGKVIDATYALELFKRGAKTVSSPSIFETVKDIRDALKNCKLES